MNRTSLQREAIFGKVQVWLIVSIAMDLTLPETNIAPENGWLEDSFPFGKAYFQGLC